MKAVVISLVLICSSFAVAAENLKKVVGDDCIRVANQFVRSGLVADIGNGSRVYGAYKGKSAYCEYLIGESQPSSCSINPQLKIDVSQMVSGDVAKSVGEQLVRSGLVADIGSGSRVYGTFSGKSAYCDFPIGEHAAVACSVDTLINFAKK